MASTKTGEIGAEGAKLIMLHGYPLSGKSTAAEKIRAYLCKVGVAARVLSSSKLRMKGKLHGSTAGFVDERNKRTRKVKDKAYRQMCAEAEKCLLAGAVPILDATHHLYSRRKRVYETAAKNATEVYVVWTEFGDKREIRKSLKKRMEAGKLTALHTLAQYETMARQTDRLEDHELARKQPRTPRVIVIRFDRKSKRTKLYNCARSDAFAQQIIRAITQ